MQAENFDRASLALPGAQQELMEAIAAVQPNIVLVLQNGGPISVDWAKTSGKVRPAEWWVLRGSRAPNACFGARLLPDSQRLGCAS